MPTHFHLGRRGLTLPEVIVLIVVILALALLLPLFHRNHHGFAAGTAVKVQLIALATGCEPGKGVV